MPITKSAIKALRQSKKRAAVNRPVRSRVKTSIDAMIEATTQENLSQAFSAIDKAVKKHLWHRNKAARVKSRLARSVNK